MNGAEQTNSLLRVLPEPSMIVSGEGTIVQVNGALLQLLGAGREAVPPSLRALVTDPPERIQRFLVTCSGSSSLTPGTLTLRLRGNETLSCRAQGALVVQGHDNASLRLLIRLDPRRTAASGFRLLNQKIHQLAKEVHTRRVVENELTDLNARLEERVQARTAELYRANQALMEKNRELQDFAFVASHDLQEPLRKIRMFLSLAREEMPPPGAEVEEYFDRIDDAAERMSTLIRDLMALTQISTSRAGRRSVDLKGMVEAVVRDLNAQITEAQGSVEVGALPRIEADPAQIRQLFQNLLSNGLKFHRPGEHPVVRIFEETADPGTPVLAGQLRIVVEDNGIGFDPAHAERIFIPFQRLHGKGEFPGSGIGLTICRRILERHGGTITARSTPGVGSRFILTFPMNQPATPARVEPPSSFDDLRGSLAAGGV